MNTEIMERPICRHEGHGHMELRPQHRQTPEQKFCGTWYDCLRCGSGELFPSPALLNQWDGMSS